ncbi:ankyrin repeat-containing domain protein [Daldinia decipiens]|uniref:ankyrin repeat-containing domain protein n=1 Tax=Daldinia decipiens TaxID=326647 RepID=UPI0020C4A4D8|nr:ankyrin repeat-containing domain protein [Daldinia decipiens]KAI1661543.1 ankyrin repeat-containing domain protein [Daldinia decipiens]
MFDIGALPNEIFDLVIEHLIISIGIFRAFILRSVNKNFNSVILFAICNKQILDVDDPATPQLIYRMPITPKARILLVQSRSEKADRDDALFVIATVNQALDDLTQLTNEQQAKQHQMIAEAVAERYPIEILNSSKRNDDSAKTNSHAHNVLMGAIVIGNLPLVKTLLEEQQADVNAINPYFGRPLGIAAVRGYLPIVRYLLDYGADPCRDDDGQHWCDFGIKPPICALGAAVRGGHDDVFQLLMKPEYSPSPTRAEYFRVILDGVKFGRLQFVQSLLQATGNQLSDYAEFGDTMFYTAVVNDQPDLVQMLLDSGVDVNAAFHDRKHRHYGQILSDAASRGNPRMVRILLDHGAYVGRAENSWHYDKSRIPIGIAAKHGHEEVVDLIFAHSPNPEFLEIAFIWAAKGGQAHLMNKLWEKDRQLHTKPWPRHMISPPRNGDIDLRRTVGLEALYEAIFAKSPAVISLLAERGVSLNEKRLGRFLMVTAKFQSARWIADFMVSLGAEDVDINREDVFFDCAEETIGKPRMRAGVYITKQTWEWGSKH